MLCDAMSTKKKSMKSRGKLSHEQSTIPRYTVVDDMENNNRQVKVSSLEFDVHHRRWLSLKTNWSEFIIWTNEENKLLMEIYDSRTLVHHHFNLDTKNVIIVCRRSIIDKSFFVTNCTHKHIFYVENRIFVVSSIHHSTKGFMKCWSINTKYQDSFVIKMTTKNENFPT